jgi:hypothetical protein
MNELKKLADEAKKALAKLENGKTYTSKYVCDRLEGAKEVNPGDILIGSMRDIFVKRASTQSFFTQKEINDVYNDMYGLSGGRSSFRLELGDLIQDRALGAKKTASASASRIPYENELKPIYGSSDLSNELSGVFSLNKKAGFTALSENTIVKASKFVKLQLESLGCSPSNISVLKTNDHFVLCSASIDTSDFMQVNVPVPVQVTNGIPSLPDSFVFDQKLVKLNKENLYVFIKDKNNFTKKVARDSFSAQRGREALVVKTPGLPSALSDYANLDNDLVAAASTFSATEVSKATSVVSAELSSLGLKSAQIKLVGSDGRSLDYSARISGPNGTVSAEIKVDMPNGSPVIPTKFSSLGAEYNLNRPGLRSAFSKMAKSAETVSVTRDIEEMSRLNFAQLIGQMESAASNADYKRAEDAIMAIESRFGSEKYLAAIDHYSKLLKHATGSSSRDKMIKEACDRGDLINVPTSIQLYSPKLGLPVSKITFDEKGRMIPRTRTINASDISSSGAMISTSKISIS